MEREMLEKQIVEKALRENFLSIYDVDIVKKLIKDGFTLYQARVMYLVYKGFLNKEIAVIFNIGLTTVKEHLRQLYKRLDLKEPKKNNLIKYIGHKYVLLPDNDFILNVRAK